MSPHEIRTVRVNEGDLAHRMRNSPSRLLELGRTVIDSGLVSGLLNIPGPETLNLTVRKQRRCCRVQLGCLTGYG
jgi:hypothetical protein